MLQRQFLKTTSLFSYVKFCTSQIKLRVGSVDNQTYVDTEFLTLYDLSQLVSVDFSLT